MRTKIGKILSVMVCVVMIASAFVIAAPTISKHKADEFDEEMSETEEILATIPLAHGTRTSFSDEGTIWDESYPYWLLYMWGYGNTIGLKFQVDHDIVVDKLGTYRYSTFYPYYFYNIRLWNADTQTLLAEVPYPYVPSNSWAWFDIAPVNLYAGGNYIVSTRQYGLRHAGNDNPGPTPDDVLEPLSWMRGYGNSYPGIQVMTDKLPFVDIHYTHDHIPDIIVPDNYTTIQAAIDAANVGDTIFVRENSVPYHEELTINKSISLIGQKKDMPIIDGRYVGESGIVVNITADKVKLRGFTITGGDYGVYCYHTNGIRIHDNIIEENNDCGVYCDHTNGIHIYGNLIRENSDCGVYCNHTIGTYINGNRIKENNDCGIYLDTTVNDTIQYNTISSNNFDGDAEGFGIYALDSHGKGVWGNTISYNIVGVKIINSSLWGCLNWNTFIGNEIAVDYDPAPLEIDSNVFINNTIAIKISGDSSLLTISNNNITGSEKGIYIESGSPIIEGNIITNNTYGIYYTNDSSPIILNNTFSNNVFDIYYAILAMLDIDPDTLNLKSRGRWITCYIELPEGYEVKDIVLDTILLRKDNFEVGGEYGEFDCQKCVVKFDRSEVEDLIGAPHDTIELTITGKLKDGTQFEGSDTIRVINPGK